MTLSDLSIRRPVFTTMMSLALVVMGLIGITQLGTDLFPDSSIPVVVVSAVYRGAGPQELEAQVVRPLEDAVAGIAGVDFIHSVSRENVAVVIVQFKLSVDLDRAVSEVRDKVAAVQNFLPRDADVPKVMRFDIGAQPILTYAISSELPTQELRRVIKKQLEPALAQLEGVAEVRVTGGDEREIRVEVDLDKAKAAGVAPGLLAQQIGMENLNLPAGRLDLGPTELTVRSMGQFASVADLASLPVARGRDGAQVRLGEVASVTDGVQDRRVTARLNGRDAVIVDVVKQPGSNTVAACEAVKKKMVELTPLMAHGFAPTLLIDQSGLIRENAKEVWVSLVFGGFMAVLIILAFLLDVRGTIISSLALPTSVTGTFFMMYAMGYTLNQMTLLALSLAIGLLIDDAVVVREAITHRLEQGESPARAASHGTRDVYLAVLATTLSLVAVFVPVAFMPGIVGQFFKQFGLTISAAVLISLFISFTLDPMLSARFSRARKVGEAHRDNPVAAVLRRFFEANERGYATLLQWVIHHKAVTLLVTLGVLAGSTFLARNLKTEFLPAEDRGQFMIDLQLGSGASLSESTARAGEAEAIVRTSPEVKDVYALVGFNSDPTKVRLRVLVGDKESRQRSLFAIKEELRPRLQALTSTKVALLDLPIVEGAGDFYPIVLRIIGPDFDVLKTEAERVAGLLEAIPGSADVRIELNPPKPELQVRLDRPARRRHGPLGRGAGHAAAPGAQRAGGRQAARGRAGGAHRGAPVSQGPRRPGGRAPAGRVLGAGRAPGLGRGRGDDARRAQRHRAAQPPAPGVHQLQHQAGRGAGRGGR